ncbi:hypothetical protein KEM54_001696, partial [Ascosphaera aggregata]
MTRYLSGTSQDHHHYHRPNAGASASANANAGAATPTTANNIAQNPGSMNTAVLTSENRNVPSITPAITAEYDDNQHHDRLDFSTLPDISSPPLSASSASYFQLPSNIHHHHHHHHHHQPIQSQSISHLPSSTQQRQHSQHYDRDHNHSPAPPERKSSLKNTLKGSSSTRSSLSSRKSDNIQLHLHHHHHSSDNSTSSTFSFGKTRARTAPTTPAGVGNKEEDTKSITTAAVPPTQPGPSTTTSTSTRDRGRAIARLFLPGIHHTFSAKSPSKSTSASAPLTPSLPTPPLPSPVPAHSSSQSQSQSQLQSAQAQSAAGSTATVATAAGGLAPPPSFLPVTLTPGSAAPAFPRTETTKVNDMFGANFVHPTTVEYIAGGYSPGGIPNYAAQTPGSIQNHIQTTAYKRIATLSYLQDAKYSEETKKESQLKVLDIGPADQTYRYDSKVHWYNTIFMSRTDISRMSYFESSKLTRRATDFLVLGLSLPSILDLNNNSVLDYLRALNALLLEFEAFQHARPSPGNSNGNGSTSSLAAARMKIPNMFKRTGHASHSANGVGVANGGKRRTSSNAAAADAGGPSPSLTSSPSWATQDENQQTNGGGGGGGG